MGTRNDQVFQLSLTEIAFTVTFVLLLLLGYAIFREQSDRLAAEAALADARSDGRTAEALRLAKNELSAEIRKTGAGNPDEIITRLMAAEKLQAEHDRLKRQVEDLDAHLSALSELQTKVLEAAKDDRPGIVREEVDRAIRFTSQVDKLFRENGLLSPGDRKSSSGTPEERTGNTLAQVKESVELARELKSALRRQLNRDPGPEEEARALKEAVSAAEKYMALAKHGAGLEAVSNENADLRGQVAFLKNRLDARGGRDYPPCWADENGKVEFLFAIELGQGSVTVSPAWPGRRQAAASELPGVTAAVEKSHSYPEFLGAVQPILDWSRKQNPECRHYVQLRSSISDAVQSDRARLMVENYFYKVEARR